MKKSLSFIDVLSNDGKIFQFEYNFTNKTLYKIEGDQKIFLWRLSYLRAFEFVKVLTGVNVGHCKRIIEHFMYKPE